MAQNLIVNFFATLFTLIINFEHQSDQILLFRTRKKVSKPF